MIGLIIGMIVSGGIIGALGRLVVPGPNPMGIGKTIVIGLGGEFLGGLVGRLVFGWRFGYSFLLSLGVAVLCTAIIVRALSPRTSR
jgi:uncharacterized membrane protein YeaQ/YmgE (transglycosylase-associated protein family)